uniref:Tail fiber protein n=1 Tax=virus sp. ctQSn51 TaxID=2828252 RepID=A0A8S5RAV8_9VIRU|nr:MAG TPA: hypothetical protein [virus sp. ctQSn51]
MADKAITDLTQALQIANEDLFVLQQNGEAKKLKGSQVVQYAKDAVAAEVQGVKEYANTAKASADAAAKDATRAETAAQGIDDKIAAADASAKAAASSAAAAAASATGVDEKVQAAQTAADNAAKSETAAKNAQTAAANAQKAAESAQTGAQAAKTAAESAQEAAESAKDAAAGSSTSAGQKATQAAQSAEDAASAKSAAETAKTDAQSARDAIVNMMVEAITLETGEPATVSKSLVDNVYKLVFGLPRGDTGAQGPQGATGNGISGIALKSGTHAPGTSDVYTITLTDGRTFDFAVYNGANGQGAGDMLASVYDPRGKRTDIFRYIDDNVPTAYTATPKVAGAASPGSSKQFARGDHVHPLQPEYESRLKWGGNFISADASPIDAAIVPTIGGNKSQFCKPDGITVEYTNDGGATWSAYPCTVDDKVALLSDIGKKFYIGYKGNGLTTNDKLRVTINAGDCGLYTSIKKILIYSTGGNSPITNNHVLLEYRLNVSGSEFVKVGDYSGLGGYPSWNSLPFEAIFGNRTATNRTDIRLTFSLTAVANAHIAVSIDNILLLGITNYEVQSNMARTGHLYAYDVHQNAKFPNKVDAVSFGGDGSEVTAAFSVAETRANIATGEKLSVLFGKVAKWFADLGSLAFKSTVAKSDLASDVQAELAAGKTIMRVAALPVSGWNASTKQQTVTVPGVLADKTKQEIHFTSGDLSYDNAWDDCEVKGVGQGTDSITFQCKTVPTADISVYVTIKSVTFEEG